MKVYGNEVAVTQEEDIGFLIAGSVYGGDIKLLTDTEAITASLLTFDSKTKVGLIVLPEKNNSVYEVNTIYISYTTGTKSIYHLIDNITEIKKREPHIMSFKGDIAF